MIDGIDITRIIIVLFAQQAIRVVAVNADKGVVDADKKLLVFGGWNLAREVDGQSAQGVGMVEMKFDLNFARNSA